MTFSQILELAGIILIVGGMLYAFYWFLKYMFNGIKDNDD